MEKPCRARLLLIDDEESNLEAMTRILEAEAYQVVTSTQPAQALLQFRKQDFDLVISDLRMPGLTGLEVLRAIRKDSTVPVILLTAFGTVEDAVEAMKLGAVDFLSKPIRRQHLLRVVQDALQRRRPLTRPQIVGQSTQIQEIKRTIRVLAATPASVLLEGESGTGKEIVASAIHLESGRKGALVTVNCGAIPETLLESELFGYERGAFTGAVQAKTGLFEAANEGTLFLDEIAELPLALQVKLLRVLQDGSFTRLGSTVPKRCDVRIIAASNLDLRSCIEGGRFREDLFYRLNVISIRIPPLRERPVDVAPLAEFFLEQAKVRYHKPAVRWSPESLKALAQQPWPGNVRELRNLIERALLLSGSTVLEPMHLGLAVGGTSPAENVASISSPSGTFSIPSPLSEVERVLIEKTLAWAGGDKEKAALALGVNVRTIYRKLAQWQENESGR
jgi:two-component system, NtrC family, response regulator HydG